jgi:hypothetical protein
LSLAARFQYSTDPCFTPTVATTLASGLGVAGVAVDAAGDAFLTTAGAVQEVLPNGSLRTIASGFNGPGGVAVDAAGDVFVADTGNNTVKEILPGGPIKIIGKGFNNPTGVAVDAAGDVFVADYSNHAVKEVLPNGSIKTLGSGFSFPNGVAVDGTGDVFVADSRSNRVVELSPPTVAARPAPLSGSTATAVTGTLTGLKPGTTYYYRAVASSPAGAVADLKNPPRSFQTPPAQPKTATTTAAASAASAAPATANSSTSADLQRLIRDEVLLAVDMALAAQGGLPPATEAAALDLLVEDSDRPSQCQRWTRHSGNSARRAFGPTGTGPSRRNEALLPDSQSKTLPFHTAAGRPHFM